MHRIRGTAQYRNRRHHGIFIIKFHFQDAVVRLPVVGDPDILNIEPLLRQQCDDMRQSARPVGDFHADAKRTLDRTAGGIDERIPVNTGIFEPAVKLFFCFIVYKTTEIRQIVYVIR